MNEHFNWDVIRDKIFWRYLTRNVRGNPLRRFRNLDTPSAYPGVLSAGVGEENKIPVYAHLGIFFFEFQEKCKFSDK